MLALALAVGLTPCAALAQPAAPPTGMVLTVNGSESREIATKKNIKTIAVSNPAIAQAVARTPTTVQVVGQSPGITTITLTDVDDKQDKFDVVVVAFDIQQLRSVLSRAVPTANINPIPAGNAAVILSGTVDRAEDLPLALQAAQSVVGGVQVINALRIGNVQQVQLDVIVATVSRDELRAMTFNFLRSNASSFWGSTVGQAVVNPVTIGTGSGFLRDAGVVSGVPGAPFALPTNIFGGVLNPNNGFLFFLQALKNENVVKLMAEPRLVSQSGRQASFLSGGEQAVPVPAGLGQIGVQFEEFGVRLNFVPVVLGNGKIHLEVEPEVSSLNDANGTVIQGTVVPGRDTQRVRTTVEMEAGQTFVIGGLIQHNVSGNTTKVPVLGELPFIGAAFRGVRYRENETEVVVLVTPHLVDPLDCSQFPKYLPGQDSRSPDDFELFLEGILEAPRGPREVCPNGHYEPAYKNDPTYGQFPCAGNGGHGGHGGNGWGGHGGMGGHDGCTSCGVVRHSAESGMSHATVRVPVPVIKDGKPEAKAAGKALPTSPVPVSTPDKLPAADSAPQPLSLPE
jgi:pilus assembly protein CpaC